MELKTEFDSLEAVLLYLTTDVKPELDRLTAQAESFEAEKRRILANRDELLNEAKSAKERARQLEADLEAAKTTPAQPPSDLEAKFAEVRANLEKEFTAKLTALEEEREAEKRAAAAERLKSAAIAELSKPEYAIINPDHFLRLHGDRFALDDQGTLFIDQGDFNRLTPAQFVQDLASRPSEAYLFKPKGGSGNGSTGSGAGGPSGYNGKNPFKRESWSLTEQMALYKNNPSLYDRLKAEAS